MFRRVAFALIVSLAGLEPAMAATLNATSPEFVIRFNDGTQKLLSSYRGKVICLMFVHTTCPHCQHAVGEMSKLYSEYGSRGFQPIAVAWNDMANMLVPDFVKMTGANFPVGFAPREDVLTYLGMSPYERSVVPQIVWIDKKGMVRSQTPPLGDPSMLQDSFWRSEIETLLKEPGPSAHHGTTHHKVATVASRSSG